MTTEVGDIRQKAERNSDVPAGGAYSKVYLSNEEEVDNEVADHPWVLLIGEDEDFEEEAEQQLMGFVQGQCQLEEDRKKQIF